MYNKIKNNNLKVKLIACVLILSASIGVTLAADPAVFIWDGGGDGVNWADSANWDNDIIPFGSNVPLYRPEIHILTDGADVLINSDVPDIYGHIQVNSIAAGVTGSATLRIEDGADLYSGGTINIGEPTSASPRKGHFKMTGGRVEINIYGARDLNMNNGTMEFGSPIAESAPTIENNSRGFSVGVHCPADVTFSGYGTIKIVGDTTLGSYRTHTKNINVIGGNLSIDFATGGGLLNLVPGIVYINRFNNGHTAINYTLDAAGASTMRCGGNVQFGTSNSFNLSVDNSFNANVGDVFTIIDAAGSFTGNGKFGNVEDNAVITAGRYSFRANYNTDSGSKFTLTVISAIDIYEFNTTSGNVVKNGEVIGKADFVNGAAVFKFDSLSLSSSDFVSITGIRPIIFEATSGDIVIDTIIKISGAESIGPEGATGKIGGYSGGTVPSGFDMPGEQGHGPGGGEGGGQSSPTSNAYGGAGGGYGGLGGNGRTSYGGVTYGDETVSLLTGGSGGGAGGRGITDAYERQGGGGAGGGAILLKAAGNITVGAGGGVISNGGNGWYTTPYPQSPAGTTIRHGGGGSGGSIILASGGNVSIDSSARLEASGGTGGSRWDSPACHQSSMAGGGGAGGRIAIYASSLTIAGQSQSYGLIGGVASVSVAGGEAGTSPYVDPVTGEFNRDGQPGSPGSVYFENTLPELEIPEVGNFYLYEGFDYPAGKISGQSGYGWDGAWKLPSDPNSAIVAGSLETTFFNLAHPSANSFYMEQEIATRKMAYPINLNLDETLYISALTMTTDSLNAFPQFSITKDQGSAPVFGWGIGQNGFYLLGLDGSSRIQTGVLPINNTVYMVVLKLESSLTGNTVSMAVYGPGDMVANEPVWQASDLANKTETLNYIRLYAEGATNQSKLAAFDEIRIADSWVDIAGLPTECGAEGTILPTDLNADCVVDLADFAIMGQQWLMTTDPASVDAVKIGFEDKDPNPLEQAVAFERAITVDGNLSDWNGAQWFSINSELIGAPDIDEASFAVAWNSNQRDTIYVAVKVKDTNQNFSSSIGTWNSGDMLEVRTEGSGNGVDDTTWFNDQNIAQMYRIAYNGSGGQWASWGVNTLDPVTNPNANLTYVAKIDPQNPAFIIYEAAVKVYSYFGGFDGGSTVLRNLSHGSQINLDFQINTVYSSGSGAMKTHSDAVYNRPSTWLPFVVLEDSQLSCGDFGYLSSDINQNCSVGLDEIEELAFAWLICTDPADENCLPIWLP